ncbi:4-hydroxy-tetrahydrodipicolinate synthase [Cohnella sp. GbtcB17]|uniref:4-hydroxy-tetrahydrodipicolinate synthase n=1 Tax=Cohnella sp. GbtcB17 TaxID=2824762 RepID=UPI001C2F85F3
MLSEDRLNGIFVPTVTPFSAEGEMDAASFRRYVDRLLACDIQGLVIGGTTGESPTITWDEIASLLRLTQEAVREQGRQMPLVVGTGTNNTASTVRRTEDAGLLGADAALVVVPYYSRPSQEGILAHFRQVAQVGLLVIVYEIPSRTGTKLSVDTARRILELDGVIGMKDSTGDASLLESLVQTGSKPVLCGEDRCLFEMLEKGARGGILASANIQTEIFVDVYRKFEQGDAEGSAQAFATVLPWIERLFSEPNPAPLKWLLAREGIIASDTLRLPMSPISQSLREELEVSLQ